MVLELLSSPIKVPLMSGDFADKVTNILFQRVPTDDSELFTA